MLRSSLQQYARSLKPGLMSRLLSTDLYDPPYLDSFKPKIPIHDTLNVQMKGYDFAILENYQKLVHKIARAMDLNIEDGWATPAKQTKIQKFKPYSTVTDSEYKLATFERNIQISDLPSNVAPIFVEMIQAGLPQGVTLRVHKHEEQFEKVRYVPDLELKQLKTQLDVLGGPVTKRK